MARAREEKEGEGKGKPVRGEFRQARDFHSFPSEEKHWATKKLRPRPRGGGGRFQQGGPQRTDDEGVEDRGVERVAVAQGRVHEHLPWGVGWSRQKLAKLGVTRGAHCRPS